MKTFRTNLAAIALLVGLTGAVVAHANEKSAVSADGELWYEFTGTDPSDPADYQLSGDGSAPPAGCSDTIDEVCAVQAQPSSSDPNQPNLSTDIDRVYKTN